MLFDKTVCINNIYFLVKERSLKIGDVEEQAGVSVGYISRLNKEESKTTPGIEFLLAVSQVLNVSLEGLLMCDYTALSPDERKTVDFLTKLLKDSNNYTLAWKRESKAELYNIEFDIDNYYATHPLMELSESEDNSAMEARFCSRFHTDSSCLMLECYKTDINYSTRIFLLSANYITLEGERTSGYEMYMQLRGKLIPICYAMKNKESFASPLMSSLISAANNSSSHVHLDDDARNAIDFYLDPDGFEFMPDDDLPY